MSKPEGLKRNVRQRQRYNTAGVYAYTPFCIVYR